MGEYAKRTCSECGLKLPQPEMEKHLVQPVGVNGNLLAAREKWFCPAHVPLPPVTYPVSSARPASDIAKKFAQESDARMAAWFKAKKKRRRR